MTEQPANQENINPHLPEGVRNLIEKLVQNISDEIKAQKPATEEQPKEQQETPTRRGLDDLLSNQIKNLNIIRHPPKNYQDNTNHRHSRDNQLLLSKFHLPRTQKSITRDASKLRHLIRKLIGKEIGK